MLYAVAGDPSGHLVPPGAQELSGRRPEPYLSTPALLNSEVSLGLEAKSEASEVTRSWSIQMVPHEVISHSLAEPKTSELFQLSHVPYLNSFPAIVLQKMGGIPAFRKHFHLEMLE